MKTWDLEDARTRFGELAQRALAHQPQRVSIEHGDAVVVVHAVDYAALRFASDLVDFVRRTMSPVAGGIQVGRPLSPDVVLDDSRPENA